MSDTSELLARYVQGVQFPEAGGPAVIRLLEDRSRLAALEGDLDDKSLAALQDADDLLLRQAPAFYDSVRPLGEMEELRRRHRVPALHWWWHLERLA